jgi:hypothetical protein
LKTRASRGFVIVHALAGPLFVSGPQQHRKRISLRPLQLLPIGKVSPYSGGDNLFIKHIEITRAPVMLRQPFPKRPNSESEQLYLKYMHAKTWTQVFCLGMAREDGVWDYRRGYITFPKYESDLSGRIFDAHKLASIQGVVHVSEEAVSQIGKANLAREAPSFQDSLSRAYPPDIILPLLNNGDISLRNTESEVNKISSFFDSHFGISPDPARYELVLPENRPNHREWREAMDEEMKSMARFKV